MKKKQAVLLFVLASVLFAISANCLRVGVIVTVQNAGITPLANTRIFVTGKAYTLGNIAPGGNGSVKVIPHGESHVEIESENAPRLIVDCYFEGGYRGGIEVTVKSNQIIAVKDKITVGMF